MIFGREPVLVATALAAILQGAWMLWSGDATTSVDAGLLLPVVTILAGWLARRKVMPTRTIEAAGLSPEAIKTRADARTTDGRTP